MAIMDKSPPYLACPAAVVVAVGLAEAVVVAVGDTAVAVGCEVTLVLGGVVTLAAVVGAVVAGAVVGVEDDEHPTATKETRTHRITRIKIPLFSTVFFK
jgi:hypothetical protein